MTIRPEIVDSWHPARLIPTTGIKGQEEQERRATSCLLAVMQAVPEFGMALAAEAGAPRGRITTFTEVRFQSQDERRMIPDGAILVERGKKRWACLVEVKTAGAPLLKNQVESYLEIARDEGFDAVLTISNEITPGPSHSPLTVNRQKLRRVALRHLSWWRITTEAIVQHRHRGVDDPDQAWILGELIAYLDHEKSGAGGFQDMGEQWVPVREAVRAGTLRAADPGAKAVAERWMQFVDYLCLGLSQDLGEEVVPVRPRGQAPADRAKDLTKGLCETGRLAGAFRVPGAIGPVSIGADLAARQVATSVMVDLPSEGRAKTRITWLLRQLKDAPADLRLEARFPNLRDTTAGLLAEVREKPERLLVPNDPKRAPRRITLTLVRRMGTKRGRGEASFVRETRRQAVDFYREIVQDLRPWSSRAPRLPDEEPAREESPVAPSPEPPPFAATDERDVGEGTDPAQDGGDT